MAFTEDLAPFFADFGIAATVGGVSVVGIFDAAYADPLGIVSSQPILTVVAADVAHAAQGAAVSINATSYTIAAIEPDGSGLSRLALRRA